MDYVGQNRTAYLLTAIAHGFQQTPLEILLSFIIVIGLLVGFSLYVVSQKRRANRELSKRSREMFEHLLGKLDLNDRETVLLGRLAGYLDQNESEHSLLVKQSIFDSCAEKMQHAEGIADVGLDALRQKIGFRVTPSTTTPVSSEELQIGLPIVLVAGSGTRLRGSILSQEPDAVVVRLAGGASPPEIGSRLILYFHNPAGIFSFDTTCIGRGGDALRLAHSLKITHHQRRKFYRSKERLPVFIKAATPGGVFRDALIVDLAAGGASIQIPREHTVKEGDLLELSFSPEKHELNLTTRVLRVSRSHKIIHVSFESISEADRSRIVRFLAAQAQRKDGKAE
ncbi:MAG TPA: PilZ domain-containing protein [Spirochaetia bacterium]|nr:PilZ domain-containing protein [Spirochaetia bacterium]